MFFRMSLDPGRQTFFPTGYGKRHHRRRHRVRHRHRYEFNNEYKAQLEAKGIVFSGTCPKNGLVEVAEYTDHPFMMAVQFHPEYQATPLKPHPLIAAFMAAVKDA